MTHSDVTLWTGESLSPLSVSLRLIFIYEFVIISIFIVIVVSIVVITVIIVTVITVIISINITNIVVIVIVTIIIFIIFIVFIIWGRINFCVVWAASFTSTYQI